MSNKIIVGITQGDSNGISYEVIIKALSDSRIFDICTPVIYGSSKFFGYYKKMLPEIEGITTNVITSVKDAHPKRINIINCIPDNLVIEPGKLTSDGAKAAVCSLEAAVKDLKEGLFNVLVTAPFNKAAVNQDGFNFTGHTEYLAEQFEIEEPLMFLVSDALKVGLVTAHMAIKDVPAAINKEIIKKKLELMSDSLMKDFSVTRPKIAVLALNPHNGDNGLLGMEEIEIIKPAIKEFNENCEIAFGPYSPDGFFATELNKKFDAVLAMYHDQGLIPFKTMSFENGVNFTAGLPIIRTSPDHGTAFEIAGKGIASPLSLQNAIYKGCDIFRNRELYAELRSNPLKSLEKTSEQI